MVVIAAIVAGAYFFFRPSQKLTEKDSIILADITNTTGDSVFDGTLRQGLAAQLSQSPFLNIVSDDQIAGTLQFMGQAPDARLTKDLARQVCQRSSTAAVIEGSIAKLENQYVVGITAVNCRTGETLAQSQVTSDDKAHVLTALGKAATEIRSKLGESRASLSKFDVPLEQATTPSLEALQSFTLGRQAQLFRADYPAAIQFLRHAVSLDPNFAMAYAALGTNYYNLGETELAAENLKRAFDLSDRVSQKEKLYITTHYYDMGLANFDQAVQQYEIWAQTYPRDDVPVNNLSSDYLQLGDYNKGLAAGQKTLELEPSSALAYGNLIAAYTSLDRLDEAQAMLDQARSQKVDSYVLHTQSYNLAFLRNDAAAMTREMTWASGKPGIEEQFLPVEADTELYSGHLQQARELMRRAIAVSEQSEEKELAGTYQAQEAVTEALLGNKAEATKDANEALKISAGRDLEGVSALAYALAGDSAQAQKLAADLDTRSPQATFVKFLYLPEIQAAIDLGRANGAKAVDDLKPSLPYELGGVQADMTGMTIYLRGLSYLAAQQGDSAAGEFQKILQHRGLIVNEPISVLSHLGVARAYALQAKSAQGGEADSLRAKARAAYQDFFALWQKADPGIPVLEEARAEFARLK